MIRVLIIDDDRLSLAGLKATLPWDKYDMQIVGEAGNGKEGLAFLEKRSVDLVMLDLAMPVMDGLTFVRKCRELHPDIQYVVMTFHEDFAYIQEALRLGVIDYISKLKLSSENQDELFVRITDAIRKRRAMPVEDSGMDDVLEMTEMFQNPLWLCDDLYLWEIQKRLTEKKHSIHQLEITLRESMIRLEAEKKLPVLRVSYITKAEDIIDYLKDCREQVMEKAKASASGELENRLLIAADLINHEYNQGINVEQIAEIAGFSRSYLSTCFNRYFGITLNGFMRRKRIYESIPLLMQGEYSLLEVSLKVGYDSFQYFKKVFVEIMGITPKEFRNRYGLPASDKTV